MASMLGAITALSLAATPGLLHGDLTKPDPVSGARPNDGQFTQLQITGTAGQVRSYTGRTETNEDTKFATDTYLVVFTMGDVSDIDVQVTDTYTVSFTMNAVALLSRAATDTYRPQMTMLNTSLTKSGTISKSAVDTYRPVMTMTYGLSTDIAATDTYTVTMTMDGVVSGSAAVLGTDTYTPVMTMTGSIRNDLISASVNDTYTVVFNEEVATSAQQAFFTFPRSDTYTVQVGMVGRLTDLGEVDQIDITCRPYGLIEITEI